MKPRIEPMPSPNGTNHERLFIVRLPRSNPGTYDSAENDQPDLGVLLTTLEKIPCDCGDDLDPMHHPASNHGAWRCAGCSGRADN
jgi:hypothetical protein